MFTLLPPPDPRRPPRPLYWLAIGGAMAIGAVIHDGATGPVWQTVLSLLAIGLFGGLLIDRLLPGLRNPDLITDHPYQPSEWGDICGHRGEPGDWPCGFGVVEHVDPGGYDREVR
jgi:hypothetical protein